MSEIKVKFRHTANLFENAVQRKKPTGSSFPNVDDGILRLVALGLMVSFPDKTETKNETIVVADGRDQNYMWTKFGKTFVNILIKKEHSCNP